MEINERWLKMSGKFGPIPPGLFNDENLDEEHRVSIDGITFLADLVKQEAMNNQDGTVDMVYNLKFNGTTTSSYDDSYSSLQLEAGHIVQSGVPMYGPGDVEDASVNPLP